MEPLVVGERVVVRYRLESAPAHGPRLTDALGELSEITADAVIVNTRRGPARIPRAAIVAARRVPPPPVRRAARKRDDGG